MATRDLIESIICGICQDRMIYPKMSGKCEHTFCKNCLQDWMSHQRPGGAFSCPYCRAVYRIPENGADGLPDNENAKALIKRIAQSKERKDDKQKLCDPCKFRDISTKASHFCGGCDGLYFCNACYDLHRSSAKTSRHEIIEICPSHSKVLKDYCVNCHKFVCMLCVLFEHSTEEHTLKPHKEILESAGEEQRETTQKVKSVLNVLNGEKDVIDRVNDVIKKKRTFWLESVRKKESEELLELDRNIERLQQERRERQEKGRNDRQAILECCKITEDTRLAIRQLERDLHDIVQKGETLKPDRSEAYVTLQNDFFQPARNLIKVAGEGESFHKCQVMMKKLQETLDKSLHRDVELQAACLGEFSLFERIETEHMKLLHNLREAISSSALENIKMDLTKYTRDTTAGINDVNGLWSFMQKYVEVFQSSAVQVP